MIGNKANNSICTIQKKYSSLILEPLEGKMPIFSIKNSSCLVFFLWISKQLRMNLRGNFNGCTVL